MNRDWWWLSFSDDAGKFTGAFVVKAASFDEAVKLARTQQTSDMGEPVGGAMPSVCGEPLPSMVGRWLTREEGEALAKVWGPAGRSATAEETQRMFLKGTT